MPVSRGEVIFIISMISLFIVVMATFIVIILFFIKKKQKGFTSDLNMLRATYDKELYKAQMEIQEQTFEEISREIHDNVGQLISMAKLGVDNLNFEKAGEAKHDADGIATVLNKALDDLRHMSRTLNPQFIKKRGLVKSIEMQVDFLQRNAGFKTSFQLSGDPVRLSETKEIILFRILQEAVNNIIRHASAEEIDIALVYQKDALTLTVKDNGNGFNLQEQLAGGSEAHGITNMQYRARLIEADYQLNTERGKGTTVTVYVKY